MILDQQVRDIERGPILIIMHPPIDTGVIR
jgi:hypothetical protein